MAPDVSRLTVSLLPILIGAKAARRRPLVSALAPLDRACSLGRTPVEHFNRRTRVLNPHCDGHRVAKAVSQGEVAAFRIFKVSIKQTSASDDGARPTGPLARWLPYANVPNVVTDALLGQ